MIAPYFEMALSKVEFCDASRDAALSPKLASTIHVVVKSKAKYNYPLCLYISKKLAENFSAYGVVCSDFKLSPENSLLS